MNKIEVKFCKYHYTKFACQNWHYSKTVPSTLVNIGIWENGSFIGVVLFGNGANRNILNPFNLERGQGCELTRVALREHKSFVSHILSKSIKLLKTKCPEFKLIVSYADENQNHLGKIYQANNWIYTGKSIDRLTLINDDILHRRTVYEKYGTNSIKKLNEMGIDAEWIKEPPKHRYIFPLNKKIRKEIMKFSLPYPKEVDTERVKINKIKKKNNIIDLFYE